jgi:hypothetical protein
MAACKLFGKKAENQVDALQPAPCPTCSQWTTGYMRDYTTINLVEMLFGPKPVELAKLTHASPQPTPLFETYLSFPGTRARFIFDGGCWEPNSAYSNLGLNYCLSFISVIEDSTFKRFELTRHVDGSIQLTVLPKSLVGQRFKEYMKDNGFISATYSGSFTAMDTESIRRLFKLIAENNEIPEPYFTQIREIINSQKLS